MIPIEIIDESAPLQTVVLGTAVSFGGEPSIDEAYDPKSIEHIKDGTFPNEQDLIVQLDEVHKIFERYDVEVYRPEVVANYNQIFSRDIGIALGDQFVLPTIFQDRSREIEGLQYLIKEFDQSKLLHPAKHERMEGGDVIPWKGHLYVGYSTEEDFLKYKVARTNEHGVDFLIKNFHEWTVYAFELNKSDTDPRANALHLDCCFQPIGHDKAIIHRGGFKHDHDVDKLVELFGTENIHFIDADEMYEMHSNIFSISPDVVISDSSFNRLNKKLESWGIKVEAVDYSEVSKMEGLLRCSTLPLRRHYG